MDQRTNWGNHVCACALDGDPDPFALSMVILQGQMQVNAMNIYRFVI
jgi:hypothetical protein